METPTLETELALRTQGHRRIAGLDEAGRGAWAGPVVAAADREMSRWAAYRFCPVASIPGGARSTARFTAPTGSRARARMWAAAARGDAAVQIDADLQDPPELIPRFLELWEEGYAVVYGVRSKRKEGWLATAVRIGKSWLWLANG